VTGSKEHSGEKENGKQPEEVGFFGHQEGFLGQDKSVFSSNLDANYNKGIPFLTQKLN
jgi:hypothetical protein